MAYRKLLALAALALLVAPAAAVVRMSVFQRLGDSREKEILKCQANDDCNSTRLDLAAGRVWLGEGWQAISAAGALAIKHFNERTATYAPALSSLSCTQQLVPTVTDTGSAGSSAVEALLSLDPANSIDVIVGAARSAASIPTALINGVLDIPQVSYWSTSATLDNTADFPSFMRTIPADDTVAFSVCQYWSSLGYKYASMLYINDGYGEAYKESLVKHCSSLNIAVQSLPLQENDVPQQLAQVDRVKESGNNVVMVIEFNVKELLNHAYDIGLLGEGSMWVFGDGTGKTALQEVRPEVLDALHGSLRFLARGGDEVTNPRYEQFVNDWSGFDVADVNTLLGSYPRMQLPADFFSDATSGDNFAKVSGDVADIGAYEYDAVMALGLLACRIESDNSVALPADFGAQVFQQATNASYGFSFEGLTGTVSFDDIGNRALASANLIVMNVLKGESNSLSLPVIGRFNFATDKFDFTTDPVFNGGALVAPPDINKPTENFNFATSSTKSAAMFLVVLSLLISSSILIWVLMHRKTRIVNHGQPVFLLLIIFGTMMSSSTIVPLTMDDNVDGVAVASPSLDAACMSVPWLYSLGFIISFAALFAKTYRAWRLFSNKQLKRIKISNLDLMVPILGLLLVDGAFLAWWTASNPLVWTRSVTVSDQYGNPVSSVGTCALRDGGSVFTFLGPIVAIHIGVLITGNVLAYLSRTFPGSFQEAKYIAMSMVSNLQIMLLGLPILIIVADNAEASLFVRAGIIFLNDFGVLMLIFVPKILVHHGYMTLAKTAADSATSKSSVTGTSSEMSPRASEGV